MKIFYMIAGLVLFGVFYFITPSGSEMTSFQWILYFIGLFCIAVLWVKAIE
jgi:hypothetical protein